MRHSIKCACAECCTGVVGGLMELGFSAREAKVIASPLQIVPPPPDPRDAPPPAVYVDGEPRCPKCGARAGVLSRASAFCTGGGDCNWDTEPDPFL